MNKIIILALLLLAGLAGCNSATEDSSDAGPDAGPPQYSQIVPYYNPEVYKWIDPEDPAVHCYIVFPYSLSCVVR